MKQLERFFGHLTYSSYFINNLDKLRKLLQPKLKDINYIWTPNDTKIVQDSNKMCKKLPYFIPLYCLTFSQNK